MVQPLYIYLRITPIPAGDGPSPTRTATSRRTYHIQGYQHIHDTYMQPVQPPHAHAARTCHFFFSPASTLSIRLSINSAQPFSYYRLACLVLHFAAFSNVPICLVLVSPLNIGPITFFFSRFFV